MMVYGGLAALVAITAAAVWLTTSAPRLMNFTSEPRGIMGTSCRLVASVPPDQSETAHRGLAAAEQALRRVEARMSTWIESSELSKLNRAGADVLVELSDESLRVLREAKRLAEATDGAFDITAGPMFERWKLAAADGRPPTEKQLSDARAVSSWAAIKLTERGAIKRIRTARVDLSGIAKGYAIDQAVQAMRDAGVARGAVDVGGDARAFGGEGEPISVGLRNPFGEGAWGAVRITHAAVCTSGNYARYVEIGDRRYSHIVDPRTGVPADLTPSVTVIAPDAMTADAWATALSVLGADGLARLPQGVHAMLISGSRDDYAVHTTERFGEWLVESVTGLNGD